jgi:hypothetical protein
MVAAWQHSLTCTGQMCRPCLASRQLSTSNSCSQKHQRLVICHHSLRRNAAGHLLSKPDRPPAGRGHLGYFNLWSCWYCCQLACCTCAPQKPTHSSQQPTGGDTYNTRILLLHHRPKACAWPRGRACHYCGHQLANRNRGGQPSLVSLCRGSSDPLSQALWQLAAHKCQHGHSQPQKT